MLVTREKKNSKKSKEQCAKVQKVEYQKVSVETHDLNMNGVDEMLKSFTFTREAWDNCLSNVKLKSD